MATDAPRDRRGRGTVATRAVAAVTVGLFVVASCRGASGSLLVDDDFNRADGLVTNELAFWRPDEAGLSKSPVWEVTSGSLFVADNTGWSGVPDATIPDDQSAAATNSAVFRAVTSRSDIRDSEVRFRLRIDRLVQTATTPAHDWDGVHVFTRYQDAQNLYAVSVFRRDGTVAVKKKIVDEAQGGADVEGSYFTLAEGFRTMPLGQWHQIRVVTSDRGDAVSIQMRIDGEPVLEVLDRDVGGAAIRAAGRVGLRTDNTEFHIDDFEVSALE